MPNSKKNITHPIICMFQNREILIDLIEKQHIDDEKGLQQTVSNLDEVTKPTQELSSTGRKKGAKLLLSLSRRLRNVSLEEEDVVEDTTRCVCVLGEGC